MSESIPIIGDLQQATPADITRGFKDTRGSLDNVVRDLGEPGLAWEGFAIVPEGGIVAGATAITVGSGRVYDGGAVYGREGSERVDLIDSLPDYDQVVVALCGRGNVTEPVEGRAFLRSTERNPDGSRNVYQRDTQVREVRIASLSLKPGEIAVSAKPPVVDDGRVVIAHLLLTPAGLVSITPVLDNRVTNARRQRVELRRLGTVVDGYAPRFASLDSALAGVTEGLNGRATSSEMREVKQVLAQLVEKADIPVSKLSFDSDCYLDERDTDTAYPGSACEIMEGIRYPSTKVTVPIELLSSLDTSVARSGSLVLPSYKERRARIVGGSAGTLRLDSFRIDDYTILRAQMNRQRVRIARTGFEVSASSNFWNTGKYTNETGASNIFRVGNEVYQVYDTGRTDAEGQKIYRLRNYWVDDIQGEPYTSRRTEPNVIRGREWVQTFLQPEDVIVTGIGPHIAKLASTAATMSIGLCDTKQAGDPDTDRMLALRKDVAADQWITPAVAIPLYGSGASRQNMPPTLLSKGGQYGMYLNTAGDYEVLVSDLEGYSDGPLFFKPSGNFFQADPAKAIIFDQYVANFDRQRTEVALKPLSLAGGIASLDILLAILQPGTAKATFEVEENGRFRPISGELDAVTLAGLPESLNWRLVFTGTNALQAIIDLADARVTLRRPFNAFVHASKPFTVPASRSVHFGQYLDHWNGAKHTHQQRLVVAGAEVTPALVTDEPAPTPASPTRILRVSSFSFASAITEFRRLCRGTTSDVLDRHVPSRGYHVCQPNPL